MMDPRSIPAVARHLNPRYKYEHLSGSEDPRGPKLPHAKTADFDLEDEISIKRTCLSLNTRHKRGSVVMALSFVSVLAIVGLATIASGSSNSVNQSCDDVRAGYGCQHGISHFWGQYSPFFIVPSKISVGTPRHCDITFAQILSRHGARDPTASKTDTYNKTIARIHSQATSYSPDYAFIKDYQYTLGADQLSVFGQQQMINSGLKYYKRYQQLAWTTTPFVRSSGQARVVESAQNWTQGFHDAKLNDGRSDAAYPYSIVVIPEASGVNNTLNHELCTAFESGPDSAIGGSAQSTWMNIFTPPITQRLNKNLPGVNLTNAETIYIMDLCPFNTVANDLGTVSPFCHLFTTSEWHSYDYYQSLGKFYGYGNGNPLGPTQGVGFVNELIARLTSTAVNDHTSTNRTLDSSPATFPLGSKLYADFSHDNDMTAIFSAMGLYNSTSPLLNTSVETTDQTLGYSASWTVPFAARMYVEKMACDGIKEEFVRVIVNNRVMPLETCGGDSLGRCSLSAFVNSLSFAQAGGDWNQCFI